MFVIAGRYRCPKAHFEEADRIVRTEFDPVKEHVAGFVDEVTVYDHSDPDQTIIYVVAKYESEAVLNEQVRRVMSLESWSRFQQLVPEPPEVLFRGDAGFYIVGTGGVPSPAIHEKG